MEQAYCLSRNRAPVQRARDATNSGARLVHYELAGRRSLNAAETPARNLAEIPPPPIMANRRNGTLRCAYNG